MVWLLDERIPSLTDLKPGSEQFHIVTLPKVGGIAEFCACTGEKRCPEDPSSPRRRERQPHLYLLHTVV